MKPPRLTPRQAAAATYGEPAVKAYELIKGFYTRYGHALEHAFAQAVGGRLGKRGKAGERGEPDVITTLGAFEFCAQANSKNSAGRTSDRREDVVRVQVSGNPKFGRISGVDFLLMHGITEPDDVAYQCELAALTQAKRLIQLPLWWVESW